MVAYDLLLYAAYSRYYPLQNIIQKRSDAFTAGFNG